MTLTLVAAYPRGSNVNVDVYLNEHHPMGIAAWGSHVRRWRVSVTKDQPDSPYEMMAFADFDAPEDVKKAFDGIPEDKMTELKEGLAKYSQMKPVIWTMTVMKEGAVEMKGP